jgi:hypothetical protein
VRQTSGIFAAPARPVHSAPDPALNELALSIKDHPSDSDLAQLSYTIELACYPQRD